MHQHPRNCSNELCNKRFFAKMRKKGHSHVRKRQCHNMKAKWQWMRYGFESNIKHAGKRIDFTANKNRKKVAHAGSAILFRKISLKLPCSRDHLLMPWVIKVGKITSKCPSFINKTLMGHVLRSCWHVLTKWHQVRVEMCRNKSSHEICSRRLLKICPSTAYYFNAWQLMGIVTQNSLEKAFTRASRQFQSVMYIRNRIYPLRFSYTSRTLVWKWNR